MVVGLMLVPPVLRGCMVNANDVMPRVPGNWCAGDGQPTSFAAAYHVMELSMAYPPAHNGGFPSHLGLVTWPLFN